MKIKTQIWNLDAKFRSWILADVYKKTVLPTELFLPWFPGLCSFSIITSGHGNKVDSNIENLFELLSVAKPTRVLVRTDKFLEPIELLGSKSDSGNMKRHPIGPAFSENSTACTRGFSSPIPSLWESKTSGSQGRGVNEAISMLTVRTKLHLNILLPILCTQYSKILNLITRLGRGLPFWCIYQILNAKSLLGMNQWQEK